MAGKLRDMVPVRRTVNKKGDDLRKSSYLKVVSPMSLTGVYRKSEKKPTLRETPTFN